MNNLIQTYEIHEKTEMDPINKSTEIRDHFFETPDNKIKSVLNSCDSFDEWLWHPCESA